MIIPIKCFQCGKPIGHLWDDYVDLVRNAPEHPDHTPEFHALKELGIVRECCRINFLCNPDLAEMISSNAKKPQTEVK